MEALNRLKEASGPLGEVVGGFFSGLGTLIQWVTGLLGEQTEAGENFGTKTVDGIIWVIDKLIVLLGWIKEVADWFARAAAIAGGLFGITGDSFGSGNSSGSSSPGSGAAFAPVAVGPHPSQIAAAAPTTQVIERKVIIPSPGDQCPWR